MKKGKMKEKIQQIVTIFIVAIFVIICLPNLCLFYFHYTKTREYDQMYGVYIKNTSNKELCILTSSPRLGIFLNSLSFKVIINDEIIPPNEVIVSKTSELGPDLTTIYNGDTVCVYRHFKDGIYNLQFFSNRDLFHIDGVELKFIVKYDKITRYN